MSNYLYVSTPTRLLEHRSSDRRASHRRPPHRRPPHRRASHRRVPYRRAPHRRASPSVHLTGVHLTGVHLISVHLTGVHLMGVHLACFPSNEGKRSFSVVGKVLFTLVPIAPSSGSNCHPTRPRDLPHHPHPRRRDSSPTQTWD